MTPLLLSIALLPRVDAAAEVAHDFGLSPLRGTIELRLDIEVVRAPTWRLEIFTALQTFVRYNAPPESPVRISPQQVHYPVGARFRFPVGPDSAWGLFAFHQSNHDVDTNDPVLNRETVSYEIYGAEWVMPHLHVHGGLYWDRGTRLSGHAQEVPFDYYLAGITVEGDVDLRPPLYSAGALTTVFHLGADHDPPHVNLAGRLDLGLRWDGAGGSLWVFLRGQRLEDYQYQEDAALHLLLLGVGMGRF